MPRPRRSKKPRNSCARCLHTQTLHGSGKAFVMETRSRLIAITFAISLWPTFACSPTYADGYMEALGSGLRAQNAGRWEETATHFDEAARLGTRYKDRDEAR